jgi:hypothetical protein
MYRLVIIGRLTGTVIWSSRYSYPLHKAVGFRNAYRKFMPQEFYITVLP